jgi:glycosyltransferase involved in cell wall biosynthesis
VRIIETERAAPSNSLVLSEQQRSILARLIVPEHYAVQPGEAAGTSDEIIDHYMQGGWRKGLDPSPTFHSLRYASVQQAQREDDRSPFVHYLFDVVGEEVLRDTLNGLDAADIRILREHFDAEWYLQQYRDVDAAAHDPLIHYLTIGWRELRDPLPGFSTGSYLGLYPDVRNAGIHPFLHWVFHGIQEGRFGGQKSSSTLDAWENLSAGEQAILIQILSLNSDSSHAMSSDDALLLAKRVASGGPEAENPTPSFNASRYLASHPELRDSKKVPFLHYLFAEIGESVLRGVFVAPPAAVTKAIYEHFDHAWYLYSYPDVEAAGHDALIHYMNSGWKERRDPSQDFSTKMYLLRNPDIVEADINPFLHWVEFGKAEGRSGASSASNFRKRQYAPTITAVLINSAESPLTSDCISAVLDQTYSPVEIVVAGMPISDACQAVLNAHVPRANGAVILHRSQERRVSWSAMLEHAVQEVASDLVWIVQGRAVHDAQFLARLASSFADSSVQIGFGRRLDPTEPDYGVEQDVLALRMENWSRHPTTPAALWFHEQIEADLVTADQPSVLWRRRPLGVDVWRQSGDYHYLGLWHLYLHMASGGQIATVRDAIVRVPALSEAVATRASEGLHGDIERFAGAVQSFWGSRPSGGAMARLASGTKRHILIVTHGIFAGGAENLPIQMANALADRGIIVSMLIFKIDVNPEMRATLNPGVSIYEADWVIEYGCDKFLRDIACSLIHSHGVIGEMFFFRACEEALPVPYVATLHGSYEASSAQELPERFIAKIVRNVDLFVYTADKNLVPLLRNGVRPDQIIKMINAMPIDAAPFPQSRADLGIAEDAIVFTLVARGIAEKGWATAIRAFQMVQRRHPDRAMHLCLVGEGDEPERLKPLCANDSSISFLGFQLRIHGLYRMTDIAIVPTRFAGESFPLCIIQALQVGVPVIATDVGQIASMLIVDGVSGGLLVEDTPSDALFDARFTDAMDQLVDDASRRRLSDGAATLGGLYDMMRFTDQYVAVYEDVIDRFAASRLAVPAV